MTGATNHPESESIREELERILRSPIFAQSERLSRFLRYTVEAVLSGRADGLKEYVIGTEVYDRQLPYHPSQDSIVRTEARRLRAKLQEYYDAEGNADPVLIYFRPGSYAPVFRFRDSSISVDTASPQASDYELYKKGRGISIAVVPFASNSEERASTACAVAITDELIHELMQTEGCRVTSAHAAAPIQQHTTDLPALAARLGVDLLFEGTVRQEGARLRVTARIVTPDGFQMWSQRFEAEPDPNQIFHTSEQIARSLVHRTRPQLSSLRRLRTSAGAGIFENYPAVLTAEALIDEGTAADIPIAIQKLEEVVQNVPEYPRPLCGIALGWYELALKGVGVSTVQLATAKAKTEQANILDAEMVRAIGLIAALSVLQWNFSEAEIGFQRAFKIGGHALVYRHYALFLLLQKRFDEAWSYLQRAHNMDAFSHRLKTACAKALFLSRRYQEIDAAFFQSPIYGPLPVEARLYLALVYLELGRLDEAGAVARELRYQFGGQHPVAAMLAEVLARCGDLAQAGELVRDLSLLSPVAGISKFRQTLLCLALGNEAQALSFLSSACDNHDPEAIWLHIDPRFDQLRDHSQFARLAQLVPSPLRSFSSSL